MKKLDRQKIEEESKKKMLEFITTYLKPLEQENITELKKRKLNNDK